MVTAASTGSHSGSRSCRLHGQTAATETVGVAAERILTCVELDAPTVFEGLSPLVADLDGDGEAELITTVSDSAKGARIRIYATDGTELSTGPVYGSGWRHQLSVAPFGPDGQPELAVVKKPHVEQVVEYYRLTDGGLEVIATEDGYTSHTYGSRNLDGALAGALAAEGSTDLLVPSQDRQRLAGLRRTDGGVSEAWSLSPDGSLTTNLAGVGLTGNRVAVGAGTADHVRIWQG